MASPEQVKIEVVVKNCGQLLEGPHWHAASQTLYFVDIYGNAVHRYRPADDRHEKVDVGENAGTIVTTASGKLVLAGKCRFSYLDWSTGALTTITKVDEDKPDNRFNDGKCDARGRFWAGTMGPEERPAEVRRRQGSLYCLHSDKSVTKHAKDLDISNGIAWSLDNKIMYYIDSLTGLIEAFDYDLETGKTSNRRAVVSVPKEEGLPDGMCIDHQGMLWLACFSKSRVNRYNPETGEKLQTIMFPATNITSCCFGGPNLDELYVTCSRMGISDEVVRNEQPLAGSLFKVTGLGVKGFASMDFAD
ncbi:regucalcin-like [Acanthaster planci]|uniref:Regucalcin n=1 Tax=Acanthaster planci TaxID=133434 RepID=A0A8B7YBI7_ACAPL|nr:regucalcin-like [Acanthaster planci]